ncbi:sensor histidine kinase [Pseudoalteromonas sp. SS15]|uniref:sensor histidine kinase n=1 Tax=Pseudoalteromonas sp. SS15 TaxID=3139393 RepID=UPI003BABE879
MKIAVQSQMLVMSCFIISLLSFCVLGLQFYQSSQTQTELSQIEIEKSQINHLESMLGQWLTTVDLFFNNRQSYLVMGIERQGIQIKEKLKNLGFSQIHIAKPLTQLKNHMNNALPLVSQAAIIGPEETEEWLSLLEEIDGKTISLIQEYELLKQQIKLLSDRKRNDFEVQKQQLILSFVIVILFTVAILTLLGIWNSRSIIQPLIQLSRLSDNSASSMSFDNAPLEFKTISQKLTSSFVNLAKEKRQAELANQKIEQQNSQLQDTIVRLEETRVQLVENEKLASIGQLAAGVAHEINNPIGYVMSNLETLEDYISDMKAFIEHANKLQNEMPQLKVYSEQYDIDFILSDLPELLNSSHSGLKRVKTIVKDLRAFSHDMPNHIEEIVLKDLIEQATNLVRPSLPSNVSIHLNLNTEQTLNGSATKLAQVLVNLMLNAADAITKQGTINVSLLSENSIIKILIEDDGCGMDDETQNNIFNPFFTTKPVGKGTGLGLHICLTIIKSHGGDISVSSEIDKGTCFTISLPVLRNNDF